jgi:hypothetical protein
MPYCACHNMFHGSMPRTNPWEESVCMAQATTLPCRQATPVQSSHCNHHTTSPKGPGHSCPHDPSRHQFVVALAHGTANHWQEGRGFSLAQSVNYVRSTLTKVRCSKIAISIDAWEEGHALGSSAGRLAGSTSVGSHERARPLPAGCLAAQWPQGCPRATTPGNLLQQGCGHLAETAGG